MRYTAPSPSTGAMSAIANTYSSSLGARIDGDAVLRDPELAQHVVVVEGRRGALAWALGVERKDASVPLVVGMEHESEEAALVVAGLIEFDDAVAHVEERLGSGGVVLADLDDDAGGGVDSGAEVVAVLDGLAVLTGVAPVAVVAAPDVGASVASPPGRRHMRSRQNQRRRSRRCVPSSDRV